MTAPMSPSPARVGDDRAGGATTFDAHMRAALAAGEPLLDNVGDPDRIVSHGLEAPSACTCPDVPGEHTEDQCAAELWKRVRR